MGPNIKAHSSSVDDQSACIQSACIPSDSISCRYIIGLQSIKIEYFAEGLENERECSIECCFTALTPKERSIRDSKLTVSD